MARRLVMVILVSKDESLETWIRGTAVESEKWAD